MNESETGDRKEDFDQALEQAQRAVYTLRLYVAGITPQSQRAIHNLRQVCAESLVDRYELEVIDIYQQPELAREAQIVAVPTLIKQLPLPLRKLVGNLSDHERVLVGLDLLPRKDERGAHMD